MPNYITEAFTQFNLLESEDFALSDAGLKEYDTFMQQAMEDDSDSIEVFDLEAQTEDDLRQSYVGKVICDCNVCHSNIFFNAEDVVIEDGIANIDQECPYCMSTDGYTIIGEIQPFTKIEDDEPIEDVPEDNLETTSTDLDIEIPTSEEAVADEPIEIEEPVQVNEAIAREEEDPRVFSIDSDVDGHICDVVSELEANDTIAEFIKIDKKDPARKGKVNYTATLKESIENVSIDTEDETMTMTTKEDGGVVIETSPREDVDAFEEDVLLDNQDIVEDGSEVTDEVIAPLSDETEADILDANSNEVTDEIPDDEAIETAIEEVPISEEELPEDELSEEETDIVPEQFDDEAFSELGEAFFRKNFNNVNGYKATGVKISENLLTINGLINFKSGATKRTTFVFESKSVNPKTNKYYFEGYNEQLNLNKKPVLNLRCVFNNSSLITEAMRYDFKETNSLNESVQLKGSVSLKRN